MIVELAIEELSYQTFGAVFAGGASAIVLHCKAEILDLWSRLVESPGEQMPWESPLIDIARNHNGGSDIPTSTGDLFYFQPGQHGYIARKLELETVAEAGSSPEPVTFVEGDRLRIQCSEPLDRCRALADRIMAALSPPGVPRLTPRISVQRLKYHADGDDLDKLAELVSNSLGRWGRLGFGIDRYRLLAAGALKTRGFADLFGMAMLIPWLRPLLLRANNALARRDKTRALLPGDRLIEHAHSDYRYFTALCGTRDSICTQVYVDGKWIDLPVSTESLVVFPGTLAARPMQLRPTLHRVIQKHQDGLPLGRGGRLRNVTLLIGAA